MSWGKGIALALGLFIAMILAMVFLSTNQNLSLVTDRYYEESLDYDRVQSMKSNYTKLDEEAVVEVDREGKLLSIALPEKFATGDLKGSVHMYCPTDSDQDKLYELARPFTISTAELKNGKWKIIVDWEQEDKAYLFEHIVFLN